MPPKKKIKKILCVLCGEDHNMSLTLQGCSHAFSNTCLQKHFTEKLEEDCFFLPRCPIQGCQTILQIDFLYDLLEKETFKKYFSQCKKCEIMSYKPLFQRIEDCRHKFCQKCFDNYIFNEEKPLCPIKNCEMKLTKNDLSNFKEKRKGCFICKEKFSKDELLILKCCGARACPKCLNKQCKIQLNCIQKKEEEEKEEEDSSEKMLKCIFCKERLKSSILKQCLDELRFRKYLKKYENREMCDVCRACKNLKKIEEKLACGHLVCHGCLEEYIDAELKEKKRVNKILCPFYKCEEMIPKKIVKRYLKEKEVEESKEGEKKAEIKPKKDTNSLFKSFQPYKIKNIPEIPNDNENVSCYVCGKTQTREKIVQYNCGHAICEEDFIILLKKKEMTEFEKLVTCPNEKCSNKGITSFDDICHLSIDNNQKKGFKKIFFKAPEINQNEQSFCFICSKSQEAQSSISLDCSHSFCQECLNKKIVERLKTWNDIESILKCPFFETHKCLQPLLLEDIKTFIKNTLFVQLEEIKNKSFSNTDRKLPKLFSFPENNSKILGSLYHSVDMRALRKVNVKCGICLDQVNIEDCLTLDCNHRFCKTCLISDWELKIKNNQVHESLLKCPNEGCDKKIAYEILKGNINPTVFEKYEQFSRDQALYSASQFKTKDKKERQYLCPNPKCSRPSIIEDNNKMSFFKCPYCSETYCADDKCKGVWTIHNGKTCQEFRRIANKSISNTSQEITKQDLEYIQKKFKTCPVCGIPIEKTKNCNYVRCESAKCQKKTMFCYLCNEILANDKMIKSHYTNENPFLKCKNNGNQKDQISVGVGTQKKSNNENIATCSESLSSRENKNSEQDFPKVFLFTCPKCSTNINKSDIFEKITNENGEEIFAFFSCPSATCYGKFVVCGHCKEHIANNPNSMKSHATEVLKKKEPIKSKFLLRISKNYTFLAQNKTLPDENKKCSNCFSQDPKHIKTVHELEENGYKISMGWQCTKCNKFNCFCGAPVLANPKALLVHITSNKHKN